jgi:serine/threonine protein kinase
MNETTHFEEAVLETVQQLPEDQRKPFLDKSCGSDTALRQRLETRLATKPPSGETSVTRKMEDDETVDFSAGAAPGASPLDSTPPDETLGSTIGRYKLLEMIGEGGFGSVYVAEQKEPVKRRVALKVIKLGMDTRQVVARFEAERQALAMMDHANIAKVLDAGSTETGRPFFVMEMVRGVRITEYCDQNKLSLHKRLELFIQVCHAIEHAHQKGIIHRDIKPSNILVSEGAVPKVIDFGIAKATSGKLTDKTVYTQSDQFVGTPAYMSPEQVEMGGLDVDTRSDIYSLGVLLYELLTAETPFESKNLLERGFDEMRRIIREIEPQLPSLRLRSKHDTSQTGMGTPHGTDAPKVINLMRGDLDWVVMKCLEKDRNRRYDTAGLLAEDVQRFLDNEPVSARPPSHVYRFQKLILRNRLAFAAASGIWVALVIALSLTSYYMLKEKAQRDLARIETEAAERDRRTADKARDQANKSRDEADKARQQAEIALQQSEQDKAKAIAARKEADTATAAAQKSETEAKAALKRATEEQQKAQTADEHAQASQSVAAIAEQHAVEAKAEAKAEAEKRIVAQADAAAALAGVRQESEASVQKAQTAAAAALAESAQLRAGISNAIAGLDSAPPAAAAKLAGALLTPAIENDPWATPLLRRRADWRARTGDWAGAAADFTALLSLDPDAPETYHALALLMVKAGDSPGYARVCAAFLARFGGANDWTVGLIPANDAVGAASSGVELSKIAALARTAVETGTNDVHYADSALTLALAELREGQFSDAAALASKALAATDQDAFCQVEASAVLAMSQQQLKQPDLARASLAKGRQIAQAKLPKIESGDLGPRWEDDIAARSLLQEAAGLVEARTEAK